MSRRCTRLDQAATELEHLLTGALARLERARLEQDRSACIGELLPPERRAAIAREHAAIRTGAFA